jgi:TonB family protein
VAGAGDSAAAEAPPPFVLPSLGVASRTPAAPSAQPETTAAFVAPALTAPDLLNEREVVRRLTVAYGEAGAGGRAPGGTVVLTLLVSPDGRVLETRLGKRSGDLRLDRAALVAGRAMRFAPRGSRAPLWVSMPLTVGSGQR